MKVYLSPENRSTNAYTGVDTNEQAQMQIVAGKTRDLLIPRGFNIHEVPDQTVKLADRIAAGNSWQADIYIALHTNAGGGSGSEVFYFSKNSDSKRLATDLYSHIDPAVPTKGRGIKAGDQFYEINSPKMPSALIEYEFHDNAEYAAWIVANTDLLAEATARGICEYFAVPWEMSDNTPDSYAIEAVGWAVENGILLGDDGGNLMLHSNITRQDMIVLLYRALAVK